MFSLSKANWSYFLMNSWNSSQWG